MRHGDTRIFKDPAKVQELIAMRIARMSFPKIALHFNCDHSTVIYHWQKYCNDGRTHLKNIKALQSSRHTPRTRIIKYGLCPICEMRIDSKYHMKNPCK